jgi:hypothetical protein
VIRTVPFLILAALGGSVAAEELLEPPKSNPRARKLRESAAKTLEPHAAAIEAAKAKKTVAPDAAAAAVEAIEDAVATIEKALAIEWNAQANRLEADAVKAWFTLREFVPAPAAPADEDARKKQEAAARKLRRKHLRDARKFVLDYAQARKFEKQFRRCTRCDGRKDLRSPFGDKKACEACARSGLLIDDKGILRAAWLFQSPLYRADSRNLVRVHRKLTTAQQRPASLGPFVRTASVDGKIENNDVWVRVHTKEKVYAEPGAKRFDEVEKSYLAYRVGEVWFLYTPRYDGVLIEIKDEPKEDKG